MIGLIIATHSRLAEEFLRAAEMIVGPTSNARAVCIQREESVEEIRMEMERAIQVVGREGRGVLIMTDMLGGTPSNISLSFLKTERVEVITGVNLPMVLKFFNIRDDLSLAELATIVRSCGQQGITLTGDYLRN
ncbi:MAG TPA: PTS sugar transporter subunit IIA [Desulfuromonadales bacterium]|nr:PTS sugar transporter subunit IIA [Desulfuromonadales bacterium]